MQIACRQIHVRENGNDSRKFNCKIGHANGRTKGPLWYWTTCLSRLMTQWDWLGERGKISQKYQKGKTLIGAPWWRHKNRPTNLTKEILSIKSTTEQIDNMKNACFESYKLFPCRLIQTSKYQLSFLKSLNCKESWLIWIANRAKLNKSNQAYEILKWSII